jgi:deoxyribonuclease-4
MHLSIAPEFRAAADRALELNCECLQIFCGNPRGWQKKPLAKEEARDFRRAVRHAGLKRVVVHASYLINPAAAGDMGERSLAAMVEELQRATALGASDYIVHPGSHGGMEAAEGERRVTAALNAALQAVPGKLRLLLENTAGHRNQLGVTVEQLGRMLQGVRQRRRVGICIDSCHAFAAGYDLTSTAGMRRLLAEIRRHVGIERLHALHVNDSKFPLGACRDRHAHLGEGYLGRNGLRRFLRQRAFAGLPAILETPRETPDADVRNMAVAWELIGRRRRTKG